MDEHKDKFLTETDVDGVLAEFDGDPRSVMRALLHDLPVLAVELEGVSEHRIRARWRADDRAEAQGVMDPTYASMAESLHPSFGG